MSDTKDQSLQTDEDDPGGPQFLPTFSSEIVTDPVACEALWRQHSSGKGLFDTWEFRYSFHLGYGHQFYFIVLKSQGEVVAFLPLIYQEDKTTYYWFGSDWQEDNVFFVSDDKWIPVLLKIAPQPLFINAINASQQDKLTKLGLPDLLVEDSPKFVVDLTHWRSVDDFLAGFDKKRRYNLKRDYRKIMEQNPTIHVNRYQDFDTLVEIAKKRFIEKNDVADWTDPRRVATFRQVIEYGKRGDVYQMRMISVEIDGQVASVDLVLLYNNVYYPVKCAYDVSAFPGIGNFVNLYEIEDSLTLGMSKIDFLENSYGWKEKLFPKEDLWKFEK